MPQDKNSIQLRPGDIVVMRFKVLNVFPHEENNNLTLESLEEAYPSNSYSKAIVNSRQVEKIASAAQGIGTE